MFGEALVYEHRLTVSEEDIDDLGHANNLAYLRWGLEAARLHWRARARPEDLAATVWVVLRHEVDYHHAAVAGDEVVVRTWVGEATATGWDRHTEVFRGGDDRLLARIKSVWCPLDARSRRLQRVRDEVRAPFYAAAPPDEA